MACGSPHVFMSLPKRPISRKRSLLAARSLRFALRTRFPPKTTSPPISLRKEYRCLLETGEDSDTYYQHISATVETKPHLTIDDGADLVALLHSEKRELLDTTLGGMEETTTGVVRLKALHAEGKLAYPIIAVNDAMTKHMFDNRYGTGQSTLDGIIRATNMLITGKSIVIIGYGWCGRGFADRARGLGAHTIVCEVDPVRALEAVMDGHRVMTMDEASKIGDIFLTVTGGLHAIDREHFENMKSGRRRCQLRPFQRGDQHRRPAGDV